MKQFFIIIGCLFFVCTSAQTFRLEAEDAVLSGGGASPAQILNDAGCSGGKCVNTRESNLTFSFTISNAGYYAIVAKVKASHGYKVNTFRFDGEHTKDIVFLENNTYIEIVIADPYYLAAGKHTIEMIKSWGWIFFDYLEIKPSSAASIDFAIGPLVTPQPSIVAQKLYQFLLDNFQRKIISGVMTFKNLATTTGSSQNEISWLYEKTGKKPALLGLDFMDHTGATNGWMNNPDVVKDAITWKNNRGIVALCWHWRDPSLKTSAFYTKDTKFDPRKIFEPQSAEYAAMMRDMDIVAGYLKELQAAGVPVLWRPLHEASGGWFWWGAQGPEACKKIWQIMFDKFTNEHHLNNLIWVWTSEANSNTLIWYPGDDCVDIIGLDTYDEGNHSSQMLSFEELKKIYKGKKLLALSECGSIPSMTAMKRDRTVWSYYMPWYGTHTKDPAWNTVNDWTLSLSDLDVIALDDMPENMYSSIASPVADEFSIDCNRQWLSIQTTSPYPYQACLYDLNGRLCLTKNGLYGNQLFSIPTSNQTCYLLIIENNRRQTTSYKIQINP
jgi:mannan endo-1,4-beta-mannosidase